MSPLGKLFGKKKEPSRKRQVSCAQCGRSLTPSEGGMMAGRRDEIMERMMQRPLYCPSCKKVYCSQCSFQAAQDRGENTFICSDCGRKIDYA